MLASPRPARRPWLAVIAAAAALPLVAGVGCTSQDRHVYHSYDHRPTTVTVVKMPGAEPIWSYDIPPQYKLLVDTNADLKLGDRSHVGNTATSLKWSLFPPGTGELAFGYQSSEAEASGVVALPGTPVQMIVTYREPTGSEAESDYAVADTIIEDGRVAPAPPPATQPADIPPTPDLPDPELEIPIDEPATQPAG